MNALREIAENQEAPASARVSACKEILDRAEGRPRQTVEATVTDETAKKYDSIANQLRLELLGADE
ncbi:hypothetical protein VSS37_03375 [Candidatus Thiothrix sp. Deng01]|uniref:Uncharacterized protein n=1 Tax=Candidatus Thiothrix phosphatis TaxID=3112415 RepID=A0ABU6CT55_9GAMM|nr:hypothetical protein [Candidatus Thiothrix sp. Deng01]MEB4590011.1 hypothetical protein [Candidatus Thiothrix sp. Deng01]